jgi:hypothetical protein
VQGRVARFHGCATLRAGFRASYRFLFFLT